MRNRVDRWLAGKRNIIYQQGKITPTQRTLSSIPYILYHQLFFLTLVANDLEKLNKDFFFQMDKGVSRRMI